MIKNRIFAIAAIAAFAGLGACRSDDQPSQEVEVFPATETTTPATAPATDPMMTQPGDTMMMHGDTTMMHGDPAGATTTTPM